MDLWDNLQAIGENAKKGAGHLMGLHHFCKNYEKVLQQFQLGLHKCSDQFEKEMLREKGFDTTTIAVTNVKAGLDELVQAAQTKQGMLHNDIVEPLDLYCKHYIGSTHELLTSAKQQWN